MIFPWSVNQQLRFFLRSESDVHFHWMRFKHFHWMGFKPTKHLFEVDVGGNSVNIFTDFNGFYP